MNPNEQAPAPTSAPAQATTPVASSPTPGFTIKQSDPNKGMMIGAIILGFVLGAPIGLIISIVAMVKSSKAGYSNMLALIFIIIFAVLTPFVLYVDTNILIGFFHQ
jgi:hypothetical protein